MIAKKKSVMKKCFFILLAIFMFIVIGASIWQPGLWYYRNLIQPVDFFVMGIDYRIYDAMHSIEVGMRESEVVRILGKPEFIEQDETIYQLGHDEPIANPAGKASFYSTGFDRSICIVFDKDDVVVFANISGT